MTMTMTTFELMKTTKFLLRCVRAYFPEEHHDLVDWLKCEVVVKDEVKMRMYGSKQTIEKDVDKFRRFLGVERVYKAELTEDLPGEFRTYRCFKRLQNEYIFNDEIYKCAQDAILVCNKVYVNDVRPMLFYYLRAKERELVGRRKLIPYDTAPFETLSKNLKDALKSFSNRSPVHMNNRTFDAVFNQFKKILPQHRDDADYKFLKKFLKSYGTRILKEKKLQFCKSWVGLVALNITVLERFFGDHPEWFAPEEGVPTRVRMFRDMEKNFVMAHELLNGMRKANLDVTPIEEEINGLPEMTAWDYNTVSHRINPEYLINDSIDFIITPIVRTRHRAVFIPTMDDSHCITAFDVFWEALHDLIFVKQLFQNAREHMDRLMRIVFTALDFLNVQCEGTRFIKLHRINELEDILSAQKEQIQDLIETRRRFASAIPNTGFGVDQLRDELERCELVETFPGIQELAESAVDVLLDRKDFNDEPPILLTCDLFDALELCQMHWLAVNNAPIADFFHNNEACDYLGIDCQRCDVIGERILHARGP